MEAARSLIHRVLLEKEKEEAVEQRRRDFKTALQELVQQRDGRDLRYQVVSASGPDHNKTFECCVVLDGETLPSGFGHSKKEAEQSAAREALNILEKGISGI